MAHLDHDALVGAFMRVDPRVVTCERGGDQGYTHVHGPSQAPGIDQCRTHWIVIEKINGTVSLRDPAGAAIGGRQRPAVPIRQHPLGYSVREDFGGFPTGLTADDIRSRWQSYDDFAREAIQRIVAATSW